MKYYEFFTAEAVAKEFDAMEQKITEHLSGSDEVDFDEVMRGFKDLRAIIGNEGQYSARGWLADGYCDEINYENDIFEPYTLGNVLALTVMEKMERDFRKKMLGRDIRFGKGYISALLRAKALVKICGVSKVEGEIQSRLKEKFAVKDFGIYDERFWGDMWAVMEYYFEDDFFIKEML